MNSLIINGIEYQIINDDTLHDGRNFFASVFYELYERKAKDDNELNDWIKKNIIDPILLTEKTNYCPLITALLYYCYVLHIIIKI